MSDGVQRGLIGLIISRFEKRGYKLVAVKFIKASRELLEEHYSDLRKKPFFDSLITYMSSGPICAMVWEGKQVVRIGRAILGETDPLASAPGTIRGDFAIDIGRNVCHGSDSVSSAKREIQLWFDEKELLTWENHNYSWIYES
ncbi:hypothetical protein T552_01945 [Pneumocystis carinii B80]|uniref:Nucleoside diphosphate kinase n=1 Tax=Pneumocystis carinii (strain B80) TaxID=1408658 RepID=A0A0W4ZIB1_PNEC8|nr:hypothetical protein T552_01945 [Pneumocystis carinii B80]KTW28084.1 hypothetical protein T552_01945 [Pneumocystis carinii B80]